MDKKNTVQKSGVNKNIYIFFKEIIAFIMQGCIKSIKSESKDKFMML